MLIVDTYSRLKKSQSLQEAHPVFSNWGYTEEELRAWFNSRPAMKMEPTAEIYLKEVGQLIERIEEEFQISLPGELVLIPSMGEIDGFARYDSGSHSVMLGIDFPDVSIAYLRALTAHELSHVYRDHSPQVWG